MRTLLIDDIRDIKADVVARTKLSEKFMCLTVKDEDELNI